MTEANQKILYEHFKRLVGSPAPTLSDGEIRVPGSIDKNFIVRQAKAQIKELERAYPHFKEKETKSEKKK